ncbi:MAG: riboflavin synthase [Rhizobiales bacterium]|nr:riboflavin synthase [Hyphomicrobiales bacterium]
MFTGIVSDIGEVTAVRARGEGLRRLKIACGYPRASIVEGASIACSGVCLTVVGTGEETGRTWFAADAAAETLRMTTVRGWRHGTRINIERALRMGDELGGHIVQGHTDGIAVLAAREDLTDMAQLTLRVPAPLARFIAPKGSVALDGISLTVNTVSAETFSALIIPHTLKVTTLGAVQAGDQLNLEVDLMARYAERLLGSR